MIFGENIIFAENIIFVDTNYFLRFLLEDNVSQHKEAKQLFLDAADGKGKIFTSAIVVFEVYWVLRSFYQRDRENIIRALERILGLEFIGLEERVLFTRALDLFHSGTVDFVDAFHLVYAKKKGATSFATFDAKLKKLYPHFE